MITINLKDRNLVENTKALLELRKSGLFTDEELQKMYEKQVEIDKRSDTNDLISRNHT